MSRPTSLLRILRYFLTAVTVVAAAFWLWLKSVEPRQWALMEQRIAQLTAQLDAGCGPRPVLHGTPIPGDAWEDYLPALDAVQSLSDPTAIWRYAEYEPDGDRDTALEIVMAYTSAIEALRKGTRRTQIRRLRFHEKQPLFKFETDGPIDQAWWLARLAACRARLLAEDDRADEALDLLLDICRFLQDVGGDGSTLASYLMHLGFSTTLTGIRELLAEGRISVDRCCRLESELNQLELSFPSQERAIQGELERYGKLIRDNLLIPELTGWKPLATEALPGWRHGYSRRLQLTTAFHVADIAASTLLKVKDGTYVEEKARWKTFYAELKKNPFAEIFGSLMMNGTRLPRERITQMRLLRMAARYVATGEFLELDDPFGGKLGHELQSDRVQLWGIGENGKHDGKGSWKTFYWDVVLEIPRRR